MATISKKVAERFAKTVPRFQKVLQLAKDRDVNESDTVSILNDIWGDVLGYDKYLEVTSELSIRGTYCDLAIKMDDKIHFLIEAKAIGSSLKDAHVKQAIDYGANHGVPWVVLTNGIEWRLYRIRFEQPISFDIVCQFDFFTLDPKDDKHLEWLFLLSKEGLSRNSREEFYEKVLSVNRYVIGNLILAEPVLDVMRRELRKIADGMKIETGEIEEIIKGEVLKREIVEGEQAEVAQSRINKFYRKSASTRVRQREEETLVVPSQTAEEFVVTAPLRDANEPDTSHQSTVIPSAESPLA